MVPSQKKEHSGWIIYVELKHLLFEGCFDFVFSHHVMEETKIENVVCISLVCEHERSNTNWICCILVLNNVVTKPQQPSHGARPRMVRRLRQNSSLQMPIENSSTRKKLHCIWSDCRSGSNTHSWHKLVHGNALLSQVQGICDLTMWLNMAVVAWQDHVVLVEAAFWSDKRNAAHMRGCPDRRNVLAPSRFPLLVAS